MSDQHKPMPQIPQPSRRTIRLLSAVTIGTALLGLSGLTLTGTVIALILATPILVLFSPILVPAGIVLLLLTTGFLVSGGAGVAAVSALAWIYNYLAGKHPMGADKLDRARTKIADKAKEYGNYVQDKAQEVTQQNQVRAAA